MNSGVGFISDDININIIAREVRSKASYDNECPYLIFIVKESSNT